MRTKSKCAQPSAPTATAVRRYTSCAWNPSGPISRHHSRKPGCHCSSARCSRLSDARSTLFGIFSSSATVLMRLVLSRPAPIDLGRLAGLAVERQQAALTGRVRTREDPVLPGREAAEDLRLE